MPPLNVFSRACLSMAIGQSMITPIHAANIVVNNSGDTDGADNICTLREAIVSANTDIAPTSGCVPGTAGTDTIIFDGAVGSTIALTQPSHLAITDDLVINGPNSGTLTIRGTGNSRIFYINSAAVSLNSMTITYGYQPFYGGGILAANSSTVNLSNSTVSGNEAANGGGIYARLSSSVSLSNSTVTGNRAASGGGILARSLSGVSLSNSTVSGNSASNGGGINATSSSVNLSNSTVSGNSAFNGGGIFAESHGSVDLMNVTVSGNSAKFGGGIETRSSSSVSLANSTVSGNFGEYGSGGIGASSSSFSLTNSIVAGNVAPIGAEINIVDYLLPTTTYTVGRDNLFGDSSHISALAFGSFSPGAGDINATFDNEKFALAAILAPLANNGGTTETHNLVDGSPAINAANTSRCPNEDQRGTLRGTSLFVPIVISSSKVAVVDLNGDCDIGSVEF